MLKSNKCSNCGADLVYNPEEQNLKCVSCSATINLDSGRTIQSHNLLERIPVSDLSWSQEIKNYQCEDCGATVTVSDKQFINHCSYCGSQNLVDIKKVARISPDAVIPFEFDKERTKILYKNWLGKKKFLPSVLKKTTPKLFIDSNYFSAFVFNGDMNVAYAGVLEYTETYTDSDGDSRSRTVRKNVKGTIQHKIVDNIIECSSNLTQNELSSITPYDFSRAKEYNGGYLFGSTAEFTDKTVESAMEDLEVYLRQNVTRRILSKHHCDRVVTLSMDMQYLEKRYSYCLLPLYILNYDYKKKHFTNLMNGQTGKLSGKVPRSPLKITFFVLMWVAIVALITLFILMYS